MMKIKDGFLVGLALQLMFSIHAIAGAIDPDATAQTKKLLSNLHQVSGKGILLGQQHATLQGMNWVNKKRCDIYEVSGQYPVVNGWDFGDFREIPKEGISYSKMLEQVRVVHRSGGINTFTWHMWNPVTGGNFYDVTPAVREILPGGSKNSFYLSRLELLAKTVLKLKDDSGAAIPIIFRPFHESDGTHFWWGKTECTREEFIQLWRYTVNTLRNQFHVHQFLYAFSISDFQSEPDFLDRYPGDEYVDILGQDNYIELNYNPWGPGAPAERDRLRSELKRKLGIMVGLAQARGKVSALTEFGPFKVPQADFWTTRFMDPILADARASQISYAMLWRNRSEAEYFGPYAGHFSVPDFQKMATYPQAWFLDQWIRQTRSSR